MLLGTAQPLRWESKKGSVAIKPPESPVDDLLGQPDYVFNLTRGTAKEWRDCAIPSAGKVIVATLLS